MIGFALDEDQVAAQKWVREFAQKEIRPVAPHYDETEEFPWPVLKRAAEIGLYGQDYYQMVASDDTGVLQPALVEELCWGCAGISLAILGTGLPLVALMAQGTPEQIGRFLPEMFGTVDDPKVGAFAVTEPGAGSDVSSLRTRAVRDGDDWVLNGQKVFITNGGIANVHVVVATVDPSLGHRGQASFIIPAGTPGLRQGKKERKLGIRASHTAEVLLDDCRVPADWTPSWPVPARSSPAAARERWPPSRRRARSWGRRRSASRGRPSNSRATTLASGCSSASRSRRSRGSPSSWRTWPPTSTPPGCWSGGPRGWAATATPSPEPRARCPSSRPVRPLSG
jgi:hypothetical protein